MLLHEDRLFPGQVGLRKIAKELYSSVKDLPLICPHGHTDPAWFATDIAFSDPTSLFITPDHYVVRMLYSQGISMAELGITPFGEQTGDVDAEAIWQLFASNYHLFRGTPTRMWLDYCFQELFGLTQRLSATTADLYFRVISDCLTEARFRPRALFDSFNIEALATTDAPGDSLEHHQTIAADAWDGRVIPCYRPDATIDPDHPDFFTNLDYLSELTDCDTSTWHGYLEAHRVRRQFFKDCGATATDHGHPTALTLNLNNFNAGALFQKVHSGAATVQEAEHFRAQMLTEMARMSIEDGLVMQLHAGSWRNHNKQLATTYGPDRGADIPRRTDYVGGLKALLDEVGNDTKLRLILFTLDESTYSRELAPLAGHYPILRLGPPWWFFDSFEGMLRFREAVTETAGFANMVGFNDDTRAFLSLPARHDMARRVDCAYLARLVDDHRLNHDEAQELAVALSYDLAKQAYCL